MIPQIRLFLCWAILVAAADAAYKLPLEVETTLGPVKGFHADHARIFLGIPYAAPPTGSARWAPPRAPVPWTKTLQATAYGPSCMQQLLSYPYNYTISEDCLFVNVFTPSEVKSQSELLPVMVFIHGGGYIDGSSTIYYAPRLATQGRVVFITLNYRLNVFGFLVIPELMTSSSGDNPILNFGMLDQQLALQWVQDNAVIFGGDPSRVTIFGESAGGGSVALHLLLESSWPLYSRAILESPGPWWYPTADFTISTSGTAVLTRTNCTYGDKYEVLACLRAVDANTLLAASEGLDWTPVIDGVTFRAQPAALFSKGLYNWRTEAIVFGTNQYEGTYLTYWSVGSLPPPYGPQLSDEEYESVVESMYGQMGQQFVESVLKNYAEVAASQGNYAALSAVWGDLIVCGTQLSVNAVANNSAPFRTPRVYRYLYTHTPSAWPLAMLNATHTTEMPFVFGNGNVILPPMGNFTTEEDVLSQLMIQYWSNVAAYGDPNGNPLQQHTDLFGWPQYVANGTAIVLDVGTLSTQMNIQLPLCEFWNSLLLG